MSGAEPELRSVTIALVGVSPNARITLRVLPAARRGAPPLIHDEVGARAWGVEPVQLLEGVEYLYEVEGLHGPLALEPGEVFAPDDEDGRRGRLRPGLHVGRVALVVTCAATGTHRAAVEVRARKLDYLRHYRWMLRDIAEAMTEVVMQRFAASALRFTSDTTRDAPTLYQRFALLRSMLDDGVLDAAMAEIVARPHRRWVRDAEEVAPGRGLPGGSFTARQVVRPGPRRPWCGAPRGTSLDTLPVNLRAARTVETVDTPENRFVRYALRRWVVILADLRDRIGANAGERARDGRAAAEIGDAIGRLDAHLRHALFREVGEMQRLPGESQVLHKREGYREVFRLFLAVESAALLSWHPEEDTWHAGQRDVATLYEYWVYLRLASLVGRVSGTEVDWKALVQPTNGGLEVSLCRGGRSVVTATVSRHGRPIELALFFNNRFVASTSAEGSWTRGMQPDCSLRVRLLAPGGGEDIWVHFDAKYRIERAAEALGERDEVTVSSRAMRDDLAKMHAYRDAIRRTAGAYVVYPGTSADLHTRFHEVLPGLGAFPMTPSEHGDAPGELAIQRFLEEILSHLALSVTQHGRWRHWTAAIFRDQPTIAIHTPPIALDADPPADVSVLVAAMKSEDHLAWIRRTRRYNLRADDRPGRVLPGAAALAARYVLLHGGGLPTLVWRMTGVVSVWTREQLLSDNYPAPGGAIYFVLGLDAELVIEPPLHAGALDALHAKAGVGGSTSIPFVTTWQALLLEVNWPRRD